MNTIERYGRWYVSHLKPTIYVVSQVRGAATPLLNVVPRVPLIFRFEPVLDSYMLSMATGMVGGSDSTSEPSFLAEHVQLQLHLRPACVPHKVTS